MRKKFTMLLAALLACAGVMKADVVKFDSQSNPVLPGESKQTEYTGQDYNQYHFTSPKFTAPADFTTLRLTFLANSNNESPAGYPCIAISEFNLYDKEGNEVELTSTNFSSNATLNDAAEGSVDALFDGINSGDINAYKWYWHSEWKNNVGDFHYFEINVSELAVDLSEFSFSYVTRREQGSPSEMLVITGSSTENVASQYSSYMILGEYDLANQAFRIRNSNITSENLYLTIETPNCNNQDEDGVKILEKAIGNESQAFKFIPQTDGSFYIKSESNYYLNTHSNWGFNAVSEAVTDGNRSNFNLEFIGNGEFRIKGLKGYVGPNNAYSTDHPYELFSNHGKDKQYIDWVLEPYNQEYLVTYNYKVGDVIMLTEEHVVNAGAAYPTVKSFYGVTITETAPEGDVSANGSFDFTCTVDASKFPFDYAADVASIDTWQYIQMHSNNKKYLKLESNYIAWADGNLALGKKDAYAWAFVGNPFVGFKMVNKAAGTEKALKSTNGGNPAMANYADGTSFLAAASNQTGNAGYFCMQYPGGNYLNAQNGKLNHWGSNDAGSTMLVNGTWHEITLSEYIEDLNTLIGNAETLVSENQANADKVGYYKLTDVQAQIDNAKNYTTSESIDEVDVAFLALQEVMKAPVINLPVAGKFYRFKHPTADAYMLSDETTKPESTDKRLAMGALEANKVSSIFYYGEDGTLLSYANGRYLSNAESASSTDWTCLAVGTTGSAATFGAGSALGRVGFYLTSGRAYWSGHQTYVDAGGTFGSNAGYDWVVEEVEWLPVAINATVGYATFYSPVELELSNGRVKAYTGKVDGNVFKLTEQNVVPANTGVILELQEGAEVENGYTFLKVKETTLTGLDNDLAGTFAKTYVTEASYVLAQKNDVVGLYKATMNQLDGTAFLNNAFKAYLPITSNAPMFSFDRGEGTTGIESSELNTQPTVIYDLLGRRVEKMEKGIYIVNGKKIIK